MRRSNALIAGLLLLVWPVAAAAQADQQDVANDVSNGVMSPYCPGVTLHDCASSEASDMRRQILRWAEAGWSEEQIMDELEAEFGPTIRATPPAEGAGALAWILPALLVAAGAAVAVMLARRWNRREPVPPVNPGGPATHEDRRRLDVDLKRLRRET